MPCSFANNLNNGSTAAKKRDAALKSLNMLKRSPEQTVQFDEPCEELRLKIKPGVCNLTDEDWCQWEAEQNSKGFSADPYAKPGQTPAGSQLQGKTGKTKTLTVEQTYESESEESAVAEGIDVYDQLAEEEKSFKYEETFTLGQLAWDLESECYGRICAIVLAEETASGEEPLICFNYDDPEAMALNLELYGEDWEGEFSRKTGLARGLLRKVRAAAAGSGRFFGKGKGKASKSATA